MNSLLHGWPRWVWYLIGFQCGLIFCKVAPRPVTWPWWLVLLPAAVGIVILIPFLIYSLKRLFGFRG